LTNKTLFTAKPKRKGLWVEAVVHPKKAFNPMPCIKGLKKCELALRSSLTNPAFPGLGT